MLRLEKFDIITLGNGKKYTISEILDNNHNKYLHLVEVDANENPLEETKVVKVVTNGEGTYGTQEIKDSKELLEVNEIFASMMEQDYVSEA